LTNQANKHPHKLSLLFLKDRRRPVWPASACRRRRAHILHSSNRLSTPLCRLSGGPDQHLKVCREERVSYAPGFTCQASILTVCESASGVLR